MGEIADILTAGLPPEAMIEVKLQAQLTPEEFQAICGPNRNIVEQMSLEADYGPDSLQTRAITALDPQGEWRAIEVDEISPETAMFLLNTLEMAYGNARNLDHDTIRERMKSHGSTIADLAVNESPPPEK